MKGINDRKGPAGRERTKTAMEGGVGDPDEDIISRILKISITCLDKWVWEDRIWKRWEREVSYVAL